MSVFLFVGQLSDLETTDLKIPLCGFSSSHSYDRRCVVWSFLPRGHVGESVSLFEAVKLCLKVTVARHHGGNVWFVDIVMFSLSVTIGKQSLVMLPFVV